MEGIIVNYRRGRKTQKCNHILVYIPGYDKKKAEKLIGQEVTYKTTGKNPKEIKGKITSLHGNKGVIRVIFERGLPGQAIGTKVSIKN